MNSKGKIAITEILILIIGMMAIAYSIGVISAQNGPLLEVTGISPEELAESVPIEMELGAEESVTPNPLSWGGSHLSVEELTDIDEPYTFEPIDVTKYTPASAGKTSFLAKQLGLSGYPGWNALFSGLQWAAIAWLAVQLIGPLFGLDARQTDALSWAAAAGFGVGKALWVSGYGTWTVLGFGALAALVVYALVYRDEASQVVTFTCHAWDAEAGGDNCEECNKQDLPCSEYQCRSLGQTCELINKGTDHELCVGISIDPNPPTIEPWEAVLTQGYEYTPEDTINPPDRGVRIVNTEGIDDDCVQAFTPLKFGVELNKPGRCRVDAIRKDNYSSMDLEISNGLKLYNHTIQFELPGMSNSEQEGIVLENDGEFELYVRCEDANGNSNVANFVFKYCVAKGPDYQAPEIVDTSVLNNFPVAFGQETLDFDIYVNEPAKCRWGYEDKDYTDLPNSMNCPADRYEEGIVKNARTVYQCSTTLEGIKDKQENKFYFRCIDQPLLAGTDREGDRNTNSESYIHTIIGTQPLVIDDAGPNGTIRDATLAVKATLTAETSAGYKEGEATCYYSEAGENRFVEFFNTNSYKHSSDLYLAEGDYEYIIKCVDLGGNEDTWQVNFTTESDSDSPEVIRAYRAENFLKVVTDEDAECVYDTQSCSYLFEDGIPMTDEEKEHFTTWNTETKFYIKCRDGYGNEPAPDECSVIIKPID